MTSSKEGFPDPTCQTIYKLRDCGSMHQTCRCLSQTKFQHGGRKNDTKSHSQPRSYLNVVAARRGKIHFLQRSDTVISTMLQCRPQEQLANTDWTPWLFCAGVSVVVCFCSLCFVFLREGTQSWVDREVGRIQEKLGEGKNIMNMYCIKFSKNK